MAKPNRPESQTGDCHDQRHHTGATAAIFRAGASRPRSNGRHGGQYARGCADPQPHPLRGGAEPHLQPRLLRMPAHKSRPGPPMRGGLLSSSPDRVVRTLMLQEIGIIELGERSIRKFFEHRMTTYAAALAYRGL